MSDAAIPVVARQDSEDESVRRATLSAAQRASIDFSDEFMAQVRMFEAAYQGHWAYVKAYLDHDSSWVGIENPLGSQTGYKLVHQAAYYGSGLDAREHAGQLSREDEARRDALADRDGSRQAAVREQHREPHRWLTRQRRHAQPLSVPRDDRLYDRSGRDRDGAHFRARGHRTMDLAEAPECNRPADRLGP